MGCLQVTEYFQVLPLTDLKQWVKMGGYGKAAQSLSWFYSWSCTASLNVCDDSCAAELSLPWICDRVFCQPTFTAYPPLPQSFTRVVLIISLKSGLGYSSTCIVLIIRSANSVIHTPKMKDPMPESGPIDFWTYVFATRIQIWKAITRWEILAITLGHE